MLKLSIPAMKKNMIPSLREISRKLVRELGLLSLNELPVKRLTQHWHALIEIGKKPGITASEVASLLLLSPSTISRVMTALLKEGLICTQEGSLDRREKMLTLTQSGQEALKFIDDYSDEKIKGAFSFLSDEEKNFIIQAISLYADALEKSRHQRTSLNIHTLSTSRPIRRQIVKMIEEIQKDELGLTLPPGINESILKAEHVYHYKNRTHFWYATNNAGDIIGSIGLGFLEDGICEVKKFFVRKEYRDQGVGRRLFAALLKGARKSSIHTLYLGTVTGLEAARRFYLKAGFSLIEKVPFPSAFHPVL